MEINTVQNINQTQKNYYHQNHLMTHPNGGCCFGIIPDKLPFGLQGGGIYLRSGKHFGQNRGFGLDHIWQSHGNALRKIGYQTSIDVINYVANIIRPGSNIFFEGGNIRNDRLCVIGSKLGIVIVEYRPIRDSGLSYSVVTAIPNGQAHGKKVGVTE